MVLVVGKKGCPPCLAAKPLFMILCEELGIPFVYQDITDYEGERVSRRLPFVMYYEDGELKSVYRDNYRERNAISWLNNCIKQTI